MYLDPDETEVSSWPWDPFLLGEATFPWHYADLTYRGHPINICYYAMLEDMVNYTRKACILFSRFVKRGYSRELRFKRVEIPLESVTTTIAGTGGIRD